MMTSSSGGAGEGGGGGGGGGGKPNNINAKSSSSAHLAPEGRRPSPEHRSSHRPATLPWTRGSGGSLQRDGPGAFLLDLHNFPDLSKADINGQNPNIQRLHECSAAFDRRPL
ncbi:hypothetical protein CRUP_005085 [Coryphaenoides rupestris]|nr:hypothetical protein CRUP_005085 [Coryphaenoides rupestris]